MHYINAHGREDFTFSPPTQSEILGNNNETKSEYQESLRNWAILGRVNRVCHEQFRVCSDQKKSRFSISKGRRSKTRLTRC